MRTSQLQYEIMVEFMERNGDLSKPSGGPRGRSYIQAKWKELTSKLNCEGSGEPRSEEKWRKVWSDYKNNCKKKCAKISRAASGTGGGPALQLCLTDLENRVMQIVGVQAATGMAVQEAGFNLVEDGDGTEALTATIVIEEQDKDWNIPGTSSEPTVFPPFTVPHEACPSPVPPPTPPTPPTTNPPIEEESWKPPPAKKSKASLIKMCVENDRNAREYAREREKRYDMIEQERLDLQREELRIREMDIRERVRQRDAELSLQAQWQEITKEALNVLKKFLEKKED
ncbi:hypothetical protein SFRURICE_018013 [Spodoptera frugiperda]|uniref:Regulatory protein zeste n=1 Tax=Spodoptera frugiperda TaxID=7108 RepID=A0A9R0CXE8_SPOFR|nr:nuclear apoptosis-inducing factor 1-like [Spodoptera frugiperda]KAF9803509.1 hypothetical protein SFRURICE_018013 [Spodoptera frugiperda]